MAASFGAVGLGSDTGNSIRGPSSHQALVGIRSTMGLTSRAGVFPLSLLADIAGPMARTVADAVAVFQVVVGEDPNDAGHGRSRAAARSRATPTRLQADALRGMRIGVLRQAYERDTTDPEIVQVFMAAVEDLRRAGATIVDPATVEGLDAIRRVPGMAACQGFKYDINAFLAARKGRVPVDDLAAIVKGGKFHPTVQRRLEQAEQGPANGPDTPECQAEAAYREQVRVAVLGLMDAQKIDVLVYPTWSNPPRLIGDLNTPGGDNSQFFSPTTGFPVGAGADGLYARRAAAGRDHLLRPAVERIDADRRRLRLRAGDAPSPPAADHPAAEPVTEPEMNCEVTGSQTSIRSLLLQRGGPVVEDRQGLRDRGLRVQRHDESLPVGADRVVVGVRRDRPGHVDAERAAAAFRHRTRPRRRSRSARP